MYMKQKLVWFSFKCELSNSQFLNQYGCAETIFSIHCFLIWVGNVPQFKKKMGQNDPLGNHLQKNE